MGGVFKTLSNIFNGVFLRFLVINYFHKKLHINPFFHNVARWSYYKNLAVWTSKKGLNVWQGSKYASVNQMFLSTTFSKCLAVVKSSGTVCIYRWKQGSPYGKV